MQYILKLKYYLYNITWKLVFICVMLVLLIVGIHKNIKWVCDYYSGPLSYIIVTGNRFFTTNDDINYIILKSGVLGTFITQDVNIIQKQIKQMPWIQKVSVRKQWPNTLKINLIEYIPIAYWNNEFISTTGVVFSVSECLYNEYSSFVRKMYQEIPILYGPTGKDQEVLNNYLRFSAILKSSNFQIKSVKTDTCYTWQLVLDNNVCLKLGCVNLIERLHYFIKVYPFLVKEMDEKNKYIDYVDLRYNSGCSVRWIHNMIDPVFHAINNVSKGSHDYD
ncbi:cell division protein FtsQ [Candidatus Blochmanniella floridana]|uniref:Cell division protein FtsQ n=1 Tax=Blochmanniella floridana TaxID=203907 RepID=FTSQ_BLOFL|nr:RecName: Full=Cell division protein FtsQ [Candidatus Blochmannia floridanus]CAD83665.1 cell division protein FtsQ [Candidatus Blochmannia floridanus]